MTSFSEILNNPQKFDDRTRSKYTKQWLKDSYNITVADPIWVSALSTVHDHDGMPYHFGQYQVGSSFSLVLTQLVELPDGWHLAVARRDETELNPVHPKHEGSFMHPENQKLLLHLRQVLRNGHLQTPHPTATEVSAFPSVGSLDIFAQQDKKEAEERADAPVSDTVGLLPGKTKSVSIDLSNL